MQKQKKFVVVAPNRSTVNVAVSGYQTVEYRHGSIVYDEKLHKLFPHIFIAVPDNAVIEEVPVPKNMTQSGLVLELENEENQPPIPFLDSDEVPSEEDQEAIEFGKEIQNSENEKPKKSSYKKKK